jgi:hypothetical protein
MKILFIKLSVLQADITDVKADAYITHAYLGGMVGSAISRKGGVEMQTILNTHTRKFLNTCDGKQFRTFQ